MNNTVKNFIDIYQKVDKEFLKLQNDICHKEAEKYFGKYYWGLTISRCSEEEFKKWWNKNKEISYNSYFYEIACYVWDIE
jgi:hypothetical protein